MAKSRQEKWIMVRLRRATHRLLLDLERIWAEAYGRGTGGLAPDERDGIGMDRLIAELIRRDADHRKRSNPGRTVPPITGKGLPITDDDCPKPAKVAAKPQQPSADDQGPPGLEDAAKGKGK